MCLKKAKKMIRIIIVSLFTTCFFFQFQVELIFIFVQYLHKKNQLEAMQKLFQISKKYWLGIHEIAPEIDNENGQAPKDPLEFLSKEEVQLSKKKQLLKELIKVNPKNDVYIYNLAKIEAESGEEDKSLANIKTCLGLKPEEEKYSELFETLLLKKEQKKELLDFYNEKIKKNMKPRYYKYAKATLLEEMEKYPQAQQMYKECIEEAPNDHNSYASYGVVLVKMNKPQEAVQMLRKSCDINPLNRDLRQLLREIEKQQEQENLREKQALKNQKESLQAQIKGLKQAVQKGKQQQQKRQAELQTQIQASKNQVQAMQKKLNQQELLVTEARKLIQKHQNLGLCKFCLDKKAIVMCLDCKKVCLCQECQNTAMKGKNCINCHKPSERVVVKASVLE